MAKKNKPTPPAKPLGGMAIAADWPVHEVLVSHDWDEPGRLAILLVARRSLRSGKLAAASMLVDLACLGVKSAQAMFFKDVQKYNAGLRAHTLGLAPMKPISINLAAKIAFTGLEYAASLGLQPDPIFHQARHLLEQANPEADPTPVLTGGPQGKPLFINGPYDNVDRIMKHLLSRLGPDNFHYLIGDGPQTETFYSDLQNTKDINALRDPAPDDELIDLHATRQPDGAVIFTAEGETRSEKPSPNPSE